MLQSGQHGFADILVGYDDEAYQSLTPVMVKSRGGE